MPDSDDACDGNRPSASRSVPRRRLPAAAWAIHRGRHGAGACGDRGRAGSARSTRRLVANQRCLEVRTISTRSTAAVWLPGGQGQLALRGSALQPAPGSALRECRGAGAHLGAQNAGSRHSGAVPVRTAPGDAGADGGTPWAGGRLDGQASRSASQLPETASSRGRVKLPESEVTAWPWHQDTQYYGNPTQHLHVISVWIPLVDVDERNGCLHLLPGSHRWGLLGGARDVRRTAANRGARAGDGACSRGHGSVPAGDTALRHRSSSAACRVMDAHAEQRGKPVVSPPILRRGDSTGVQQPHLSRQHRQHHRRNALEHRPALRGAGSGCGAQ